MILSEVDFHAMALRKWREREMTFPARVRRLEPDAMDRAAGTWSKFIAELRRPTPPPEGKE